MFSKAGAVSRGVSKACWAAEDDVGLRGLKRYGEKKRRRYVAFIHIGPGTCGRSNCPLGMGSV
ncbi:exported hypothetical protein [Candidatus Nitrospira nitrificans]|uniref:Uncharacterized protein n=1 Tax=Candidatus Nitrospira nitrificans TaxID=1742973 RepID=A0A0S4L6X5_9BACT|nr:exported hypothetical protein [Candidatus Nitrospira nitrificans]